MTKTNRFHPSLAVNLGQLALKNPITVASGTFGYGIEYNDQYDIGQLGGIDVKGLTLEPRTGHPQTRLHETASGLLNCIGLQNVGVQAFISEKLPILRKFDTKIIANINGSTLNEYAEIAARLDQVKGVHALEVNVSCPNVKEGGITFGTDAKMTEQVTRAVIDQTSLPVIVKLSPNVTDISDIAKAAWQGGAHSISLINTLLGMAINPITRKPVLSNITGGLSGPAIKPVALRCVYQVHQAVPLPILGMGGICTGLDVIEFLLAGATAISVGSANFQDPQAGLKILHEITQFCCENRISDIRQLIGAVKPND